jgi:hypothetical protein
MPGNTGGATLISHRLEAWLEGLLGEIPVMSGPTAISAISCRSKQGWRAPKEKHVADSTGILTRYIPVVYGG